MALSELARRFAVDDHGTIVREVDEPNGGTFVTHESGFSYTQYPDTYRDNYSVAVRDLGKSPKDAHTYAAQHSK